MQIENAHLDMRAAHTIGSFVADVVRRPLIMTDSMRAIKRCYHIASCALCVCVCVSMLCVAFLASHANRPFRL